MTKKQILDQSAHLILGGLITFLLNPFIGIYSLVVVFIAALIREFLQHKGEGLGKGSIIDMIFWMTGANFGIYI